jgi:hypothetical protein
VSGVTGQSFHLGTTLSCTLVKWCSKTSLSSQFLFDG